MFYILIMGVFCVYVTWKMWYSEFNKKRLNQPPDASGRLPIIGHTHQLLGNSRELYRKIIKLSEECRDKGGVVTLHLGLQKMYLLTDPEDCLTISNTCLEKHEYYKLWKPFFGDGLITADGPTWKKHRKLLNPAFNQSVLNSFMGIFNSQARLLVQRFAQEVGKPFEHENMLKSISLESICLTATGSGGEEYSALQKQYLTLFPKLANVAYQKMRKPWLHKDFIFNMSALKKIQDELLKPFLELSKKIICMKKSEIKKYEKCSVKNKPGKMKTFMEIMLDVTNETGCFTEEEIRAETDTMIAAGYETSAITLCLVFMLLGSHLDIQAKVYNEIIEVIGSTDTDIDKDGLSKLVYTEAVLKETLRFYPVVPLIARYADRAVKLKNCTVEANTGCIFLLNGVNRPLIWGPDADQFRPERWLDTANVPDPNNFGTFGLGKRSCIGKVYAMMSMKTSIAHVVRRYRISADITKMIFKWQLTITPHSGFEITLEPREACK